MEKDLYDQLLTKCQIYMQKKQRTRQNQQKKIYGPTLKLLDGKIVIDHQHMVDACHQPSELSSYSFLQQRKTQKKKYTKRWSLKQTEKFYMALRMFGTNFEMISSVLQNRTRNSVKNKYKKQCKVNPFRIAYADSNRIKGTLEQNNQMKFILYLRDIKQISENLDKFVQEENKNICFNSFRNKD